jgi:hypothetical protein
MCIVAFLNSSDDLKLLKQAGDETRKMDDTDGVSCFTARQIEGT